MALWHFLFYFVSAPCFYRVLLFLLPPSPSVLHQVSVLLPPALLQFL